MKRIISTIGVLALLVSTTPTVQSQETGASGEACRIATHRMVAQQQINYRQQLFGLKAASGARLGTVRYQWGNSEHRGWAMYGMTPWIKVDDDKWENVAGDEKGDRAIDGYTDPHPGIFETKRMTTSELIPHLLQAVNILRCRLAVVCEMVRSSLPLEDEDYQSIKVSPRGCYQPGFSASLPMCHLQQGGTGSTVSHQIDNVSHCNEIADQVIRHETDILKMLVEYDAAYRSMLQLAGDLDLFLQELRWPLTNGLRDTVQLVGTLERIPCFVSSCTDIPAPPKPPPDGDEGGDGSPDGSDVVITAE